MKRYSYILAFLLLSNIIISCSSNNNSQSNDEIDGTIEEINAFPQLIKHFEREGNYINENAPSVIKPEQVFKELNSNIHLIDIRDAKDFAQGHIKESVNISPNTIINHLWNDVIPSQIDKIIIVGYDGNDASYVAGLLRLLNYYNVYAMKWGIAGWNKTLAENTWLSNTVADYSNILVSKYDSLNAPGDYPYIKSCESTCAEALEKRVNDLLQKDYSESEISIDELLKSPDDYYIVNYWPRKYYDKFHLPGARQYEPYESLSRTTVLNTLPIDKTIVVYCYTGHHSAFVVAFLNLLGYNAKNLEYGVNSFMNKTLKENDIKAFSASQLKNYPLVTGN